jgi:ribosome-binding factor A
MYHHERLREQLMREIGWVIKERVRDPRVPMIVSVSDMKLAPDSRNATVFVHIYGDETVKEEAVAALNRASPFIQRLVAERVRTRHFPKLRFKLDDSVDKGMHIDDLLREIRDDLA